MFDFNPFREFKEMMKQRRLQEAKANWVTQTLTTFDPTTGSGRPPKPRSDSIDTNIDNGEEWRRSVDEIGQQIGISKPQSTLPPAVESTPETKEQKQKRLKREEEESEKQLEIDNEIADKGS